MKTALIVYSTWTGATRSVAEGMGQELRAAAMEVKVSRAGQIKDLSPYQSVIVCSSVHMGLHTGEIKRFLRSNRKGLSQLPVAYCIVCLAAADEKEESRVAVQGYIQKLQQIAPEIPLVAEVAVFGGVVLADTPEFKRLFPLLKKPVRSLAAQPDRRDWAAIRGWVQGLKFSS